MLLIKKLSAAVGTNALIGLTVGVLAVSAAAVAGAGSSGGANWGQQVLQQVLKCKAELRASGIRGIGECVSDFASQHGKQVSASHHASEARTNGSDPADPIDPNQGHGKAFGHTKNHGHGNGNGHGNGHGKGGGNGGGSN